MDASPPATPSLAEIEATRERLGDAVVTTGNHALAVAYGARRLGISAKVVMHKAANPFRVARARHYGAEVVLAEDIAAAFAFCEKICQEEGRSLVHPFEGPHTIAGTATVGLEIARQAPAFDAIIVPVGGGGLIAGVASALKQLRPQAAVYGVEPMGARGMSLSLAAGRPLERVEVATIADSLGAPLHTPGTFALVQRHVDELVLVEDAELRRAMGLTMTELKLAVEPAGAAALAALSGPFRTRLAGARVVLLVCGANIDPETYARLLTSD
jgi:threonine dehydratase